MRALALVLLVPSLTMAQAPLRLGDPAFRVGEPFTSATRSPDGKLFAVMTHNGFRILDADTGQLLLSRSLKSEALALAFNPSGQLVVGEKAGWVRFLDPRSGKVLREVEVGVDVAQSVTYSLYGGGRILYISTTNGCIGGGRYFDLATERECPPKPSFRLHVGEGDISPDGRLYAAVDWPPSIPDNDRNKRSQPVQRLRVHEIDTGQDRWFPLPLVRIVSVRFDATGRTVTVRFTDRFERIDIETGRSRTIFPEELPASYFGPVFSPAGDRFAVPMMVGNRWCIREWDADTGRFLSERPTPGSQFYGLAYTPAGRLLNWNSYGTCLRVGDVHASSWPRVSGHLTTLTSVRFSGDGRRLESMDRNARVCAWDTSTGQLLDENLVLLPTVWSVYPEGVVNPSLVRRLEVSETHPDAPGLVSSDSRLMVTSTPGGLSIHDVRTGALRRFLRPPLPWYRLSPLTLSPDNRSLLVFSALEAVTEGEAQLIELATGSIRCRWSVRAPAAPPRFSPDGKRIAYPQQDGTILLLPTDLPAQSLDPATLWRDLGSRDAAVANVAVQALAARPGACKEIAARRVLLEDGASDTVDPVSLLPDLDADDPAVREVAQSRLRTVPTARLEVVLAALLNPSPEVRRALREAIDEPEHFPEPTAYQLRRLRVAEVLERIAQRD
jgi:WD40 repeat protein